MKLKVEKFAFLIAASGFSLLSSSHVYGESHVPEIDNSYWGKAWSFAGKCVSGTKIKIQEKIEESSDGLAEEISEKVWEKIYDVLYLDDDRVGVDCKGRPVKVYTKDSRVLNKLFANVFGVSLDEMTQGLPGGSLLAKTFRRNLEGNFTGLLESVTEKAIKEVTRKALYQMYGIGKNIIGKNTTPKELDISDFVDLAPSLPVAPKELNVEYNGMSLNDVIEGYHARLKMFLNDKFREFLEGALVDIAQETSSKSFKNAKNALYGTTLFSGNIPAAVASAGVYLFEKEIKSNLAEKAARWTRMAAAPKLNQVIFSVDYDKLGYVAQKDVGDGWTELQYTAYDAANFFKEKVEAVKNTVEAVVEAVQPAIKPTAQYLEKQYNPNHSENLLSGLVFEKDGSEDSSETDETGNEILSPIDQLIENGGNIDDLTNSELRELMENEFDHLDIINGKSQKPEVKETKETQGFLGGISQYFWNTYAGLGKIYNNLSSLKDLDSFSRK